MCFAPRSCTNTRDVRVRANDRAGRAGVIEVNVRQQDVTHVIPPDAVLLQAQLERAEAAGRTRIDDARRRPGRCTMPAAMACGPPQKLQIDPRKSMTQCVHWIARIILVGQDPWSRPILCTCSRRWRVWSPKRPSLRDIVPRLAVTLRDVDSVRAAARAATRSRGVVRALRRRARRVRSRSASIASAIRRRLSMTGRSRLALADPLHRAAGRARARRGLAHLEPGRRLQPRAPDR